MVYNKFLMAQESDVTDFSDEGFPKEIEVIPLPGHFFDMVEGMEAAMFVPAHAEASPDIKELVRYNRDKIQNIAERILSICGEPMHFERILQEVFRGYGLSMNFEQYVFERARTFMYRNARPLDMARFQYHFEDGGKEAVMQAGILPFIWRDMHGNCILSLCGNIFGFRELGAG